MRKEKLCKNFHSSESFSNRPVIFLLILKICFYWCLSYAITNFEKITFPRLKGYSLVQSGDVNGDGKIELLFIEKRTLLILSTEGKVIRKVDLPAEESLSVKVFEDVTGDGKDEIIIGSRDGKNLYLRAYTFEGKVLRKICFSEGAMFRDRPDSGIDAQKMLKLDDNNRIVIIASITTGYAWKPRGVYVFDYETGQEVWRVNTGPFVTNIEVGDITGDGKEEIVFGTYSPANGNEESSNDTDDFHCYVFAVNNKGQTMWIKMVGTYFTGSNVALADLNGDRINEVIACKSTAYDFREDEGGIFVFDGNGNLLKHKITTYSIKSLKADVLGDKPAIIYGDRFGNITILDSNLKKIASKSLQKSNDANVSIEFVKDIDGDGQEDIGVYSFSRKPIVKNPRTDVGPKSVTHYFNIKVEILDRYLSTKKGKLLADMWNEWLGVKVLPIGNKVYCFADNVYALKIWLTPRE